MSVQSINSPDIGRMVDLHKHRSNCRSSITAGKFDQHLLEPPFLEVTLHACILRIWAVNGGTGTDPGYEQPPSSGCSAQHHGESAGGTTRELEW